MLQLALFVSIVNLVAQESFEKGTIVDTLQVSNTTNETFALYLPKSFDSNKPSPIVIVFEPAARGRVGIGPFISASEQYGFIVVCSNSSKNGPYERNIKIAQNLIDHIFSNFRIDGDQVYLAGFSGGARLATAIGSSTEGVKAVIACGAGFAANVAYTPTSPKFHYVGLVGDMDMNYAEMVGNKDFLDKFNINNTLFTFEDYHRWPESREINRAFRWLALQDLKARKDTTAILENYVVDHWETRLLVNRRMPLEAAENYQRILKSYGSFVDTDSITKQLETLQNSKPYRVSRRKRDQSLKAEQLMRDKLFGRIQQDFASPDKLNLKWWDKEAAKLDKLQKKGGETEKMIKRLKSGLFAMLYERHNTPGVSKDAKEVKVGKRIIKSLFPNGL